MVLELQRSWDGLFEESDSPGGKAAQVSDARWEFPKETVSRVCVRFSTIFLILFLDLASCRSVMDTFSCPVCWLVGCTIHFGLVCGVSGGFRGIAQ